MTVNQILLAVTIEYHWWRIKLIRKRMNRLQEIHRTEMIMRERFHKEIAEKLAVQYEISAGLREY